jgi:predicted aspartyl protease
MGERRPCDFVIALVAMLVILGLLFWLFLLWGQSASRTARSFGDETGARPRIGKGVTVMIRPAQLGSDDAMGTFYVDCTVQDVTGAKSANVSQMLVDSGSEHTWVPATVLESIGVDRQKKDMTFQMAYGATITRNVGFAIVRCGPFFTVDEVVFAQPGDLTLLGARTLEGFNARVDAYQKKLVAAGPIPAASAGEQVTMDMGQRTKQ